MNWTEPRDYLVTGCQDLEGDFQPGGSTIHVEHARGLSNVLITNNRCRHSILAGGVDGLSIIGNQVTGRIVGNGNSNLLVQGNLIITGQPGERIVLQRTEQVTVDTEPVEEKSPPGTQAPEPGPTQP